ncbi:MAG: tRNA (adenosine(37)-N6)-threonylcarbamoyltransferase complex ATPase subunit type 1 TsaE [Planctomycetaceae bacterium]|nr:tRNA (adenosine(37)-N6)-threonylcarbamoyltransferase complex ATPase subunit type 1 TsaE [Planctomycetaceae bacterium]
MGESLRFVSQSLEQSDRFGRALAQSLLPGLTVALNGELGAGKTALVRSVSSYLGADPDQVNSPTFVLLQLYVDGRLPVAHFDTYRLGDVDEFLAIGGEDYLLDEETVCFVEWAERISDALPPDHLQIRIAHAGESSRRYEVLAAGPQSRRVLQELDRQFDRSDLSPGFGGTAN